MISTHALQALANKYQTTELNVRREYVQHLFLSYFYQQAEMDRIYFKGGTALRMLFHSPRFSEDLDFASLTTTRPIEQAVLETLQAIERENIQTDLKESTKTSGGYLAIVTFQIEANSVSLELNISLREGKKKGEVVAIASDYLPTFTVVSLVREQLVDEKIQALLSRKKARDYYDLYFILRANLLPPAEKRVLPKVLTTLRQTRIDFGKELTSFLPKSHWALIRDFRATCEREIERFL